MKGDTLVLDSEWHWIFDCPHFEELRMNLPVFERTLNSCRTSNRGFALAEDLVSLLKKVQIEYRVAVSLGSFIRQAIALRASWISNVCAKKEKYSCQIKYKDRIGKRQNN